MPSSLRGLYYGYYEHNFQSLVKIVCDVRDPVLLYRFFVSGLSVSGTAARVYPVPYTGENPRIDECSIPYRRGDAPASIIFSIVTSRGSFEWNCIDVGNIVCMPLAETEAPPPSQETETVKIVEGENVLREEIRELLGPEADEQLVDKILQEITKGEK